MNTLAEVKNQPRAKNGTSRWNAFEATCASPYRRAHAGLLDTHFGYYYGSQLPIPKVAKRKPARRVAPPVIPLGEKDARARSRRPSASPILA